MSDDVAIAEAAVSALEAAGVQVDRNARPEHEFGEVFDWNATVSSATSPGRTDEEYERLLERSEDADPHGNAGAGEHDSAPRLASHVRTARTTTQLEMFFRNYDIVLAPTAFIAAFEHIDGGNLYREPRGRWSTRPYADLIAWTTQWLHLSCNRRARRPHTRAPVGLQMSARSWAIGQHSSSLGLSSRSPASYSAHRCCRKDQVIAANLLRRASPQLLEHLAGGIARQLVNHMHTSGNLNFASRSTQC